MAIIINGRNLTRNYEEIERNIFKLSENLSINEKFKIFLAQNTNDMFKQLKSDFDNRLIDKDTYGFYLKRIKNFMEMINQPITMNLLPEVAEEFNKQNF